MVVVNRRQPVSIDSIGCEKVCCAVPLIARRVDIEVLTPLALGVHALAREGAPHEELLCRGVWRHGFSFVCVVFRVLVK